jgi:hypothetical protein
MVLRDFTRRGAYSRGPGQGRDDLPVYSDSFSQKNNTMAGMGPQSPGTNILAIPTLDRRLLLSFFPSIMFSFNTGCSASVQREEDSIFGRRKKEDNVNLTGSLKKFG